MLSKSEPGVPFSRHKAMKQLHKWVMDAYRDMTDRLFKELLRYVGDEIVGEPIRVKKSGSRSEHKISLLTPAQLETLKGIIRDHHYAFAAGVFGPDAIPPSELKRLTSIGLMPEDLTSIFKPRAGDPVLPVERVTDLAYRYGEQIGDPKQQAAVVKMGIEQFKAHLDATREDLGPVAKQAMAWARYNAGQYVRGMGDRLSLETGVLVMNADAEQRRQYLGTIQKELEDSIDKKKSWRELASNIGHATADWSRDMQRLAATEQQFAMQEGCAREMAQGRDPREVRVAKIPAETACDDCVRLHLTGGKGSPPRIFKLSELQANGTNVGRQRRAWEATIGPVHPWCECQLVEVPDGWGFNDKGELLPEILLKKGDRIDQIVDLLKSEESQKPHMTYQGAVPTHGVTIRIADPQARAVAEAVVESAPPEIFDKDVGITLITTDTPRIQNPLEEHDFAYWTGNEIRVNQTLPIERWPRVLRHEIGHSLNVYLMHQLKGADAVRKWHDRLEEISKEEGYVSPYAKKLPIENAAEATRMYLFDKARLMLNFPRQFAFLHRYYRPIFEAKS